MFIKFQFLLLVVFGTFDVHYYFLYDYSSTHQSHLSYLLIILDFNHMLLHNFSIQAHLILSGFFENCQFFEYESPSSFLFFSQNINQSLVTPFNWSKSILWKKWLKNYTNLGFFQYKLWMGFYQETIYWKMVTWWKCL